MERRRFSPLDDYVVTLNEPPELQNRRVQFYNDLRHFYRRRWGCPLKVPAIQGVDVDLFQLYEAVVALGGWQKVSNGERWAEVVREARLLDDDVQMAEFGARMLYMRYLSKFEQAEFGNENDDHDSELLTTRGRLKSMAAVAAHAEAPVSMPRAGLSEVAEKQNYWKLMRSLLAGLPNEVDFALNICTIVSHPGPYLLRLADCPQMLTVFAAHCGVFDDGVNALADLHLNAWRPAAGRDFSVFWRRAGVVDAEVRALIAPILAALALDGSAGDEPPAGRRLFAVDDRHLDLKQSTNWRIFQILSICRNLSFEDCNRLTMAASVPLLKFLVACCHTKYQVISNSAFETLANIASEIDLGAEGSIFDDFLLLKTVARALQSADKFEVLQALEILAGLCRNKNNESVLCDFLSECVLARIFALVTVRDINICLTTLESLYQMSEMGRSTCELIGQHNRAVDILVDLTTTDAASFGFSGLMGIKVVETNPLTGHTQPYQQIKPPREQQTQSVVHSAVANASLGAKPFTTMVGNGGTNAAAPRPAIAPLQRPLQSYQPLHHHQGYTPVPPSPLAASGSQTPRPLAAAYPAPPTPAGVTVLPANHQPLATELLTKTPGLQPNSVAIATLSATTPKSSKVPAAAAAISVAITPSSSSATRGRRFTAGLRQSALREKKEKSAAKAASMRAVQEVVAAMSTSAGHRKADEDDGLALIAGETGESRLEHLTKAWIHTHCALLDDAVANRGEMYAAYVEHIQSTKLAGGGAQMLAGGMQMFINQLKAIFPSIIITHSPGSTIHAVEGIRFCKDGIQNDVPTKSHDVTSEAGGGLLIAATATRPLSGGGDADQLTSKAQEDDVVLDKKALANGFLHNEDSQLRPHQNGDIGNVNGVPVSTDNNPRNNNDNGKNVSPKDVKETIKEKEEDGLDRVNDAASANGSVNGIEAATVKMEESVIDDKAIDDKSAPTDESVKYLEDDEEMMDESEKAKRSKMVNKSVAEEEEDKVSSTIDSLLKSTSATDGQTPQSTPTSVGRGKRRTTNGHGRGFAKRAKPTADLPKPIGDGMTLSNGITTTALIGQPVALGCGEASTSVIPAAIPSASVVVGPVVLPELMCEWDCCGRLFTTANAMLFHNTADHLCVASSSGGPAANQKFVCRWPGCDATPRSKWSITTHLQDHHCTEPALQMALRKRLEMGAENYLAWCRQRIAKVPLAGCDGATSFSRISALDAVRRHALVGVPNEITDDSEGPITRSMRLTSCLVIRNIAKHSVEGRRRIRKYESHLCRMALSRMESNVVLAQALAELSAHSALISSANGAGEPLDGVAPATPATPTV